MRTTRLSAGDGLLVQRADLITGGMQADLVIVSPATATEQDKRAGG